MPDHDADVKQILSDIQFVRTAISKNAQILKFLALPDIIRAVALATGLLIMAFSSVFYLLIRSYGSFGSIPAAIRILVLAVAVGSLIALQLVKVSQTLGGARKVQQAYNLNCLIREIYSAQAVLVLIPFFVVAVSVAFLLESRLPGMYTVQAMAVLVGLLLNALAIVLRLRELMVAGDWQIAAGLLFLFYPGVLHPLLILSLTFGMSFVAMAVIGLIAARAGKGSIGG